MRIRHSLLLAIVVLCVAPTAPADSLWFRHTPQGGFLFVDNRARQVGDLLTIVVQENTGIDFNETRDASKQTSSSATFGMNGSTQGNVNTKQSVLNLSLNGGATRALNGTSQYTSDRSFADRMTVTVVAVMPNGNLMIEGETVRIVSGESRTLHVTGVVRPIDVAVNNTVPSPSIANLRCTYTGKGQESHFTASGWFNRIVNKVWPY